MADMTEYTQAFEDFFDTKARTIPQNDYLHVVFREIATECNVLGLDQKVTVEKFFKQGFPVTEDWVKYTLFHPVMEKLYNVKSTTKLDAAQFSDLLDMFLLAIEMRLGIHIARPE